MSVRHKFITINNRPVSLSRVRKYIEFNQIPKISIPIDSILDTNVLPHWCYFCVANGNTLLYDQLTIRDLYTEFAHFDKVDTSEPILMMDNQVIDGIHRILKSKINGLDAIDAYQLTADDFLNILKNKYKK